MKTSFDNGRRALSPGTIVNMIAIRRAVEAVMREFDFLGDAMPHKMEWTDRVRPHETVFVYANTMLGRAVAAVKVARDKLRSDAAG